MNLPDRYLYRFIRKIAYGYNIAYEKMRMQLIIIKVMYLLYCES